MGRVLSLNTKFRYLYSFNYFSSIQYRAVDAAVIYQEVERDPAAFYVQFTLFLATSPQNKTNGFILHY